MSSKPVAFVFFPDAQVMAAMPNELDQVLYDKVMEHLVKIKEYIPGPVKKVKGVKGALLKRYREDPLYSIFGLDSDEYIWATLSGGTVTRIHRKLGDIYRDCRPKEVTFTIRSRASPRPV